ncbi:hypothetical protein ACFOWM_03555 [Ferruginibacter yonginensis]|uniref:Uncharacterized protein n=1 Tax=Ferruginibacter yonginensis TaxID=1310416 RepID=A0ABV8QQM4_9BACT
MQIITQYHELNCLGAVLINYLPMLSRSLMLNVERQSKVSPEFLQSKLIVAVVQELEEFMLKKLAARPSQKIKLKLSDAQGIILYKTLLDMPIASIEHYQNLCRSNWLKQLDQQIIHNPQNYMYATQH